MDYSQSYEQLLHDVRVAIAGLGESTLEKVYQGDACQAQLLLGRELCYSLQALLLIPPPTPTEEVPEPVDVHLAERTAIISFIQARVDLDSSFMQPYQLYELPIATEGGTITNWVDIVGKPANLVFGPVQATDVTGFVERVQAILASQPSTHERFQGEFVLSEDEEDTVSMGEFYTSNGILYEALQNTDKLTYPEEGATWRMAIQTGGDALPWVTGPQREGQLSFSDGKVWRAKEAIDNSQVAPEDNPGYYDAVGAEAVFDSNFTVSLSGGKSFGRYANGQVVPALGKTAIQVLKLVAIEKVYPSYTIPTISLTQTASPNGEEGESVSNTITATYTKNNAGDATSIRIYRGITPIASDVDGSVSATETVVRTITPIVYAADVSYSAGAAKPVPPDNEPDDRDPELRQTDAPQAADDAFSASSVMLSGYPRMFYGNTAASPTTSTAVRALSGSQLVTGTSINSTFSVTLNTGTANKNFVAAVPTGWTLDTAVDTSNQNANVKSSYVASAITVNNAANAARNYTKYEMVVQVAYNPAANHVLTFKKTS